MRQLFAGINVPTEDVHRIRQFTRGWPILVMMVHMLARRGRLDEYFNTQAEVADVYGWLYSEILNSLSEKQRRVLVAGAALPDTRYRDLAALFCRADLERALTALERSPFVSRRGDEIDVHPAVRQMLQLHESIDDVRAQLFAAVDRSDGGVRAAQIALLRGRPDDAVSVIAQAIGPYVLTTPGPELNSVLSALPIEFLGTDPEPWNAATWALACRMPHRWLANGLRFLDFPPETMKPDVRLAVASVAVSGYFMFGQFGEIDRLLARVDAESTPNTAAITALLTGFWRTWVAAARGEAIDLPRFESLYEPVIQTPSTRVMVDCEVVARDHRIHGRRAQERATLDLAVARARATGLAPAIVIALLEASFGAWLAGEDALHRRYVADLRESIVPNVADCMAFYLSCARGRMVRPNGTERLSHCCTDTWSPPGARRAPAASRVDRGSRARGGPLVTAVAQVLARIARALTRPDPGERYLDEAVAIALGPPDRSWRRR